MKLAFSTVACPEWTLEHVAQVADSAGYLGVELRTFGSGASASACDPALSAPAKTLQTLGSVGCEVACVATGCRFDEPVTPPVIGWAISDTLKSVRDAVWCVELAARLEAPMARVFGHEISPRMSRKAGVRLIADRLAQVVDAGRARQVRVVIENGGSFATAAQISELLDAVASPLLGVAYDPAVAAAAGEPAEHGINVLGDRLLSVKLRDFRAGAPCALGDGELHVEQTCRVLKSFDYRNWIVVEHDRAWFPGTPDPTDVLHRSAERLYGWLGAAKAREIATHKPGMLSV